MTTLCFVPAIGSPPEGEMSSESPLSVNGSAENFVPITEDDARSVGADELIAEIQLSSGTTIAIGASIDEPTSADELARNMLLDFVDSLSDPSVIRASPSVPTKTQTIAADEARKDADRAELESLLASGEPIPFTEARNSEEYVEEIRTASPPIEQENKASQVTPYSSVGKKWWPEVFQSSSYTASNGRTGKLAFYWSAAAKNNLVAHSPRATFEPDFVTYNYDQKHFFDKTIVAWSSSLPGAYKDTQFLDSSTERVYTIGSSNANAIKSGVSYQTLFRTNLGNSSVDKGKVVAQLGTHIPGCTSTWCISANESRCFFHSPMWSMPIPSGNWTSTTAAKSIACPR